MLVTRRILACKYQRQAKRKELKPHRGKKFRVERASEQKLSISSAYSVCIYEFRKFVNCIRNKVLKLFQKELCKYRRIEDIFPALESLRSTSKICLPRLSVFFSFCYSFRRNLFFFVAVLLFLNICCLCNRL